MIRASKLLLFLVLSAVYHSNLRPVASGDSLAAALIPFSVVLDGSVTLDRFGPWLLDNVWYSSSVARHLGGHWYSSYPIAGPVLASPLYLPLLLVPGIRQLPPPTLIALARIAEKFVAVHFAALAAVLLLLLLERLVDQRTAWFLTLVFAFATGNWSTSSQALWQHSFGGVFIIASFYAINRNEERWHWIAALCAACALAIRPTNLVLLPALALVVPLRVLALPAISAVIVAAYNVSVFGNLLGNYPVDFGTNWLDGLLGILFSPGRGLLIYTPIAIFALAAFLVKPQRRLAIAAAVFAVLQIALVAKWTVWYGGYCWGPRLLTEILGPLIILIAIGWSIVPKKVFAVAAVYGVLIQALGVYCYPRGHWDHTPTSITENPGRLWDWGDNPIVRTAKGGIAWEPYAIVYAGLTGGPQAAAKRMNELGIQEFSER